MNLYPRFLACLVAAIRSFFVRGQAALWQTYSHHWMPGWCLVQSFFPAAEMSYSNSCLFGGCPAGTQWAVESSREGVHLMHHLDVTNLMTESHRQCQVNDVFTHLIACLRYSRQFNILFSGKLFTTKYPYITLYIWLDGPVFILEFGTRGFYLPQNPI